jgi:hypothetical protein
MAMSQKCRFVAEVGGELVWAAEEVFECRYRAFLPLAPAGAAASMPSTNAAAQPVRVPNQMHGPTDTIQLTPDDGQLMRDKRDTARIGSGSAIPEVI